jgi:hypothetical protein
MRRIFQFLLGLSTLFALLFSVTDTFASLSVLTEGNPRTYVLAKVGTSTFKEGEKIKPLKFSKAFIIFEGANLKKGEFVFKDNAIYESLNFNKAKIKVEDGTFSCQGILKSKNKQKSLDFDLILNPIKDGFDLKAIILKEELIIEMILKKE